MTTDTSQFDRAMNNPELMKRANREGHTSLTETFTPDNRLCLIAAATMMVLERGKRLGQDPRGDYYVMEDERGCISESPDLLAALLDALEESQ